MPSIGYGTLPQEFYDRTSAALLLAPEPQYPYAHMWMMALNAYFESIGMVGLTPDRAIPDAGDRYQTDAERGRLLLNSDGITDKVLTVVSELGKGPGDTIRINRPSFTDSSYTEALRQIPSGTTISTTPIAPASEQVMVTLRRYGGPYSSGVAPYGIERFDAGRMVHNAKDIAKLHLVRDFHKTLETFITTLFDNSGGTTYADGITADTDMAVAGDTPLSYRMISDASLALDERNVPRFANGRRILMLHPRQKNQLKHDSQFSELSEFHPTFNPLFAGSYFKSIDDFDIFSSNTLNTNASTTTVYKGQAFGPAAVGSGISGMPRCVTSSNDNYGETVLLLWLMYAGFATFDSRFIQSVRSN